MGDHFVPPPAESNEAFLMRLVQALGSDSFQDELSFFLNAARPRLQLAPRGEEQRLETYDVYREFSALMEKKLEGFAREEGLSDEGFKDKCEALKHSDPGAAMFVDALIASWDFDSFMGLAQAFLMEEEQKEPDQPENKHTRPGGEDPQADADELFKS